MVEYRKDEKVSIQCANGQRDTTFFFDSENFPHMSGYYFEIGLQSYNKNVYKLCSSSSDLYLYFLILGDNQNVLRWMLGYKDTIGQNSGNIR